MKYSLFFLILFFGALIAEAQPGQIFGRAVDRESGSPLPGANIIIDGTSMGTASDNNGNYIISNIPPGSYEVIARYLGYEALRDTLVIGAGERLEHNVRMTPRALEGEAVIVRAQAEGQWQAINEQLASRSVTNIVSRSQIQALPEANAAEAVGRLPGVSLERSGGEGTKVVIRGMSPKYSLIQIDGVTMAATGSDDRSVDLSMISPYMLEGIELTKSVMANQEATATGGIVNFRIKTAPEKPSLNVMLQGGHNNLRGTYGDFKASVGGSNRFFSNRFGVYAQVDYEEKDAGSQQLGGVSFSQDGEDAPVRTNSMELMDIFRNVQRIGGTVVMDFKLPSTTIRSSNFYSRVNREETRYQNTYNFTQQGFDLNYSDTPESWLSIITNSLQIDHRWRNFEINTSLSHSYSDNITPARINATNSNSPRNPFPTDRDSRFNVNLDPETIPTLLNIPLSDAVRNMHLGSFGHEESETRERDLSASLNLLFKLDISRNINVDLRLGGMFRHKTKSYDRTRLFSGFEGGAQASRNLVYEYFKDELSQRSKDAWERDNMRVLLIDFFDNNYDGGDFLGGRYDFGYVFDRDMYRRMHSLLLSTYDPDDRDMYDIVQQDFVNTNYYDYHGKEDYHAFYVMPEINLGSNILFVPGVRYESNRTEYTGYRGSRLGVLRAWTRTPIDTVSRVRENEFLLPMINAFYRPVGWLTIKAGYTHTLQRPNYSWIIPSWVISSQGNINNLGNFRLKPELSRNIDLQLSVYSNKIGLVSAGVFHKEITDMIFWTGQKAVLDTTFFDLPTSMYRQRAAYAVNNEYKAVNYGYEIEWQSNFWYLPGLLKGLVLNVNYTRNKSEADYLRTRIRTVLNPDWSTTLINEDTTYTSPLINQPAHLLNLTLGYDYKGFSIRGAMRFTSHVFRSVNWYEDLRGYSTDFYRYDLAIRQKLPLRGLEMYLNINNMTNEIEQNVINHRRFASYIEDYGRSANMGLRYQF